MRITSKDKELLKHVKKLKEKIPHIESTTQDNICYATKERQDAVRRIASSVDLLIVVGSSHSSNANRLKEVALNAGAKNAILIDSKDNLIGYDFDEVNNIAITSAASTPDEIVQELLEFLKQKLDIVIQEFNTQNEREE